MGTGGADSRQYDCIDMELADAYKALAASRKEVERLVKMFATMSDADCTCGADDGNGGQSGCYMHEGLEILCKLKTALAPQDAAQTEAEQPAAQRGEGGAK